MAHPVATIVPAGVQLLSAALYFWVARIVLRRRIEGEARRANALFALWWIALGFVFLLSPLYSLPPRLLGYRDLPLAITVLNVSLLLIVAAVWGLVYYLAYVYTGSSRWFWPITAFYAVLALVFLYLLAWLNPTGFDGAGRLVFERKQLTGAPAIALGLMLTLPVVVAALGYGSLFFQVREAAARYRIGLVSGAFLLQFGWSTASTLLQLSRRYPDSLALSLVSNALGLVSAVAILLAFRPPRAVRKRLGLPGTGSA
jgi:hypothetical protein